MKLKCKVTKVQYLDSVRDLTLKDVEIANLEKKIFDLTVKNRDTLYDNILESLGEMYCKLDILKQEREILHNVFSKTQNDFFSFHKNKDK